ncbi:hypothetical protein [Paractinoplanes lichenicola]|uniref:Secreted protein n=1 Tax=Paractinoplanes lichenicola TaxID=2802976 RepID=A0ABS1VHN3_9ACTN|nr:hypothetical protein [Actinoplanes lichenicola]MBL7252961.1 hypothetical protein [Actinoplanes lichenicola]
MGTIAITGSLSAVALTAAPAQADPCGANSWVQGNDRYVGYRNCGSSTVRLRAVVGGNPSPSCVPVAGGSSALLGRFADGAPLSWSVQPC